MKSITRLFALLFALAIITSLIGVTSFADETGLFTAEDAEDGIHFIDEAYLFSSDEAAELKEKLDALSNDLGYDVIFLSVPTIGSYSPMVYADDFYDQNGYGTNGILFLVNMGERDIYFSTAGKCIGIFTDYGIEYLVENVGSYLTDKEYSEAVEQFISYCRDFTNEYNKGTPYDTNHKISEGPGEIVKRVIIALIIGFIISLVVTGSMKGKLKTVRKQAAATTYVRNGSMQLTDSRDLFLYTNVTRTEIPKNDSSGGGSSTHTSSGGVSHGGGGGKF